MTKTLIFTGGHHNSALTVAIKLREQGWNIVWLGHRHSMWKDTSDSAEYKEVTAAGIRFYDLKAGKLYRTFNPFKLIRIPLGFIQSLFFFLKIKNIKGIYSSGGYLAVPVVICGWFLGIPSVTHEQTVVAGLANRLIAIFAKKIAVTWSSSLSRYPQNKAVLTGLPLRPEILNLKRHPGHILYITGGKQGSHVINETIFKALPQLLDNFTVVHQTGSSSVHNDYQKALNLRYPNYHVYDYLPISQLAPVLSQAQVIITRAGAHTVYELAYLKIPSVTIPIPWASHDEQNQNAKLLADHQLSIILPEANLNPDTLLSSLSLALKLHPLPISLPANSLDKLVTLAHETFI